MFSYKAQTSYSTAIEIKKLFGTNFRIDEIDEVLRSQGLRFLKKRKKPKPSFLWRLTMPFYLIIVLIAIVISPIKYLITGSFQYEIDFMSDWSAKIF